MTTDPLALGRHELDNTPWWIQDNTTGSGQGLGRCNPFGFEDDNIVVMGGTADPRAEKYLWYCRNHADGKYRMTCANGHAGTMRICYAHVHMIRKRMNGVCPRCAKPPRARDIEEQMNRVMQAMAAARSIPERRQLAGRLEDLRAEMNEMIERGTVSTGAPLRLEEVS